MDSVKTPPTIVAADWSKSANKRRAVKINAQTVSDSETLIVEGVPAKAAERLESLLEVAHGDGALIGIDAVVGIPEFIGRASGSTGFLDWLKQGHEHAGFFDAVESADDWSPWRPFWKNPSGKGSQKRFFATVLANHPSFPSNHGLRRTIDRSVAGKPPTCTHGMPGTVGSGTAALWRELAVRSDLAIWPFAGSDLPRLLTGPRPVLAETYPAICYEIVLAERLPTQYVLVAKTQHAERCSLLERLTLSPAWEPRLRIDDALWRAAHECEDDFDALFMALALYRLAREGYLNHGQWGESPLPDPTFEGGIVGSWCVTKRIGRRATGLAGRTSAQAAPGPFVCPLAGCNHVFKLGRGGWDGHIASIRRHPEWHPEERDGTRRKKLFREEFRDFFCR